jgi:hypothetical protein
MTGKENTYQAGWEAAKQRLADSGFSSVMEGMEFRLISGEVLKTEAARGRISISINPLEPLADPELDTRIIIVDSNTKIIKLAEKDMAEYEKEMAEFDKQMGEQMAGPDPMVELPMPPEFYTRESADISSIVAGQMITVSAGEDIKEKKEFKATEITIQSSLAMPALSEVLDSEPPLLPDDLPEVPE